jgi:hypothetical protein
MTRHVQPLPPELACMVMQYLHDDFKSLKRCSLVHPSWRREAQKLLFGRNFVRIGVTHDSRSFPLSKRGEKRSPSEFVTQIKRSPHLIHDIRAVRINIADMHRIITSTRGDDAWTLSNVLAAILSMDKLETLAFFSIPHLRDFYPQKVNFPNVFRAEPLLEEHFSSVIRLELQTCLHFPDLCNLQNLLCSLPALEEVFLCPLVFEQSSTELPSPPSNVSLRRLMYENRCRRTYACGQVMRWLATTDTRHSLERLTINSRCDMSNLQPLIGAITKPFSMVNLDANNCVSCYFPSLIIAQHNCIHSFRFSAGHFS